MTAPSFAATLLSESPKEGGHPSEAQRLMMLFEACLLGQAAYCTRDRVLAYAKARCLQFITILMRCFTRFAKPRICFGCQLVEAGTRPFKGINGNLAMTTDQQIAEYIAGQPETRRSDLYVLDRRIREISPHARLWFLDGKDKHGKTVSNPSIGYGLNPIRYANGKMRDFYSVGLSANTGGISVYVMGLKDKKILSETFGERLGKASISGYCIRFKTLADIDVDVLDEVFRFGLAARA